MTGLRALFADGPGIFIKDIEVACSRLPFDSPLPLEPFDPIDETVSFSSV